MTSDSQSLPKTGKSVYVIGVTGGIGSGKSAVGAMLSQMGVTVFDTDHIARDLRDKPGPVQDQIVARFGADLLNSDGSINREKLGRIVFDDPQARKDLEDILHPAIAAVKQERIEASEGIVAVLVPLLYETSSQRQYDEVWTVVVEPEVQLARLRARDKRSDEELKKRIAAQLPQDAKAALSLVVIDNSGDLAATREQVDQALVGTRERFAAKVAPAAATPADGAVAAPQAADEPVALAADAATTPNPGSVDGAEAASPADTDKAPPVPADGDGKENHYQGVLRDFGHMATEEALAKLGQVSRTAGKEANASVSMVVSARDTGGSDAGGTTAPAASPAPGAAKKPGDSPADQERELRVDVKMSVRNRPGQVDTPAPGNGSSGNGNGNGGNGNGHGPGRFHSTPLVLGLFGLLAFLAFILALVYGFDRSHTAAAPNPTQVTVNPPNVTVTVEAPQVTVNNPPVVVVDGSGCVRCPVKPVEVQPLPVKPVEVTPPVVTDPCQAATDPDYLSEPPAFALRYIHNEVRWAVAQWTVGKNCTGTIVEGRDKEGRLLVRQVYRSYLAFVGQETFKYLPDGRIQVDRFDSNNIYVGRTYR